MITSKLKIYNVGVHKSRIKTVFNSETKLISDFIQGNVFYIPKYQRPYSWTTIQAERFWDDISSTCSIVFNNNANEMDYHFLGAVITKNIIPEDNPYPEETTIEIIDGQQRTLTTILLLSILNKIGNRISESIYKKFSIVESNKESLFNRIVKNFVMKNRKK